MLGRDAMSTSYLNSDGFSTPVSSDNPLPVNVGDVTLTVTANGVEITNTDQAPVPVYDAGGSLTVDGPLTDAELRATPVPISGTVAISNSSLEITNDSGNPLPVSGTVTIQDGNGSITVDGPLTDTQLRATAVPVSGSVSVSGTVNTLTGLEIPDHDYVALSYTNADLTGVVYKTGGSGGTTVATLTLAYTDGKLTSITKS